MTDHGYHKELDAILRENDDTELWYMSLENKDFIFRDWKNLSTTDKPLYRIEGENDYPFLLSPHPSLDLIRTHRYLDIPRHIHANIEMGYMYSGSCVNIINDKPYIVKKGQIYILDSAAPHEVKDLGEDDILITAIFRHSYFTNTFFNRFSKRNVLSSFFMNAISQQTYHNDYILFQSQDNRRIELVMNELMMETLYPTSNSVDVINSLLHLLFLELISVYEKSSDVQNTFGKTGNLLGILKYIEANFRSCTLKSTAEHFNMNPNYLTTLLKKHTGSSFKELQQEQRFQYITMLLRNTDLPIEEIAYRAGYERTTTYFHNKFRSIYGCSPKEYRERLLK